MKTKFDRKLLIPATILALVMGLIAGTVVADPAVVAGPNFEIDGNTAQTEGADDWETVILGGAPDWGAGPGYLILDGSSGPKAVVDELNIFAKGGKFEDPTTWTIEPGNSPAQNDLTNIYIYPVIEGLDDHSWMVMGMERIKKQGTFDLDFEYNQVGWDGSSGTLVRTDGDVMVGFELSGNPEDPEADLQIVIAVYKPGADCLSLGWVEYGEGWCEAFRGSGEELALSDYGIATMNGTPFDQAPWGHYQSSGAPLPDGEQVAAFFFAEAAIDLTELDLEPSCPGFGSVHVKSRSSLEVTADLKDLAGPLALPVNCYIDGYKYLDVNGNGSFDGTDSYLDNWQIDLYKLIEGTFVYVESQMTAQGGYFRWDNLSDSTYKVVEVCPTSTPPWVQTEPGVSTADSCGDEFYSFDINIDNRDETLYFGNGKPDIAITKTCDAAVFVGDDIQYGITVTNTGNVDLVNVTISDTLLAGFPLNIGDLYPGEAYTISPTYTATTAGSVSNTASVSGNFGDVPVFATVDASDNCTTQVYELTVTKDATTTYTRTYEWDITKTVTPAAWQLFNGESGTSLYTVSVNKTGYTDSAWAVNGTITVSNPAPIDAKLAGVSDVVSPAITATVNCGVSFPYTLAAGGTLTCSYSTNLPDASSRTNTATATLTNGTGFSGSANMEFDLENPTTEIYPEINVTDTNGESWGPVSDDDWWTYERTFTCDADEGQHDNTATIVETGQSASASVTVNCYELAVTKDATTTYTRTYEWDITKTVTPAAWQLFTGESGESQYTVSVDKTGFTDSEWAVSGEITVSNMGNPIAAEIAGVSDVVSPAIAASVECGVTFPYTLAAGGTLTCSYSTALPDAASRTNTATATQNLYNYPFGDDPTSAGTTDYSGSADVEFDPDNPTIEVYPEINVTDTNGESWGPVSDDTSWTYERTFTCDADEGQHDNTATIVETEQSASASVTVDCYQLTVTKDATTTYKRYYDWTIEKLVDGVDELGPFQVFPGGSVDVTYTIEVGISGYTDGDWAVDGFIYVDNTTPIDAELTGVADVISSFGAVTAECGVSFPYTLAAGSTLTCSYSTGLPDGSSRTNTATATQQLYDYAYDGTPTAAGTTEYSGSADIIFGAPSELVDEFVEVTDDFGTPGDPTDDLFLGTLFYNDALPVTFTYIRTITAEEDFCGSFQIDNTATLVEIDTSTVRTDDATVLIEVPCEGCTPGFWQGGAGSQLWNEVNDPDWTGEGTNPFVHTTLFNSFFSGPPIDAYLDGFTMLDLIGTGGGSVWAQKAARDMVAAYLNESAFPGTFPAENIPTLLAMWYSAVAEGDPGYQTFHDLVAGWNDPPDGGYCPLP